MPTPRGDFYIAHMVDIKRAAGVLEQELRARGIKSNKDLCLILAMHACAAFANVPETPASQRLQSLEAFLDDNNNVIFLDSFRRSP